MSIEHASIESLLDPNHELPEVWPADQDGHEQTSSSPETAAPGPSAGTPEATGQTYDPQHISLLILNSFRFSQGSIVHQNEIIKYIASNFGANFEPSAIKKAIPIAAKTARAIVKNPSVHPQTGKDGDIKVGRIRARREVKTYARRLTRYIRDDEPYDIKYITKELILRDREKTRVDRHNPGRPRAKEGHSPFSDPYFSNWVYYGLMGHTTGTPEYDQMFTDMVETFEEGISGSLGNYVESTSNRLLRFYLEHHPDQADLLPEQYTS